MEERFIWTLSFRSFHPWSTGSSCFGLEAMQNIIVTGTSGGGYSLHGSQKAERESQEGAGSKIYIFFKGMPPVKYFLQPGPPPNNDIKL
jgi:hypothetical protein